MNNPRRSRRAALAALLVVLTLPVAMSTLVQAKEKKEAMEVAPPVPTKTEPVMAPEKVKALEGIKVKLELQEELYGKHSKVGQEVHYLVADDVSSPDNVIVLKKGAVAIGHVLLAQGTGSKWALVRKGGKLNFNAEYANASDGTWLPLNFDHKSKGMGGAGAALLFGPGAGKDARAHKGRIYEATIGTPPPVEAKPEEKDKDDAKK